MTPRFRAWLLILIVTLVCGLTVGGVFFYRSRALSPSAMLKRMPANDALVVYVDFAALRRGGILQMLDGSKVGEDPEYRQFVQKTDFDYKNDLDAAMVAFGRDRKYMLLKGRFDWKSLTSYVRNSAGACNNSFCRMAGSTPEKRISFFPLKRDMMALAVSTDEMAAEDLTVDTRPEREIPDAPVWLSIPPSIVRTGPLPDGAQMFARSLERAQAVTLAIAPDGNDFTARLHVRCLNEPDASNLAAELTKATSMLRDLITRERQTPNPTDFSGFFTSGTFRAEGPRVRGDWRIPRAMIDNLLGGA